MAQLPPGVYAEFPPAGQLTPLFRQYTQIKAAQPDALLFYRLGDFYELFGADAVRASSILGLTLTARSALKDYKVAMCGVPHHSSVRYIKRLVEAGEVVAICEQLEDPAASKGLVERGITRVITAGTLVEEEYLAADSNNFLVVLAPAGGKLAGQRNAAAQRWGIAMLESSGGRAELSEWSVAADSINQSVGLWQSGLVEAVLRYFPAEILVPAELAADREFMARLSEAEGFARPALSTYHSLPGLAEARELVLRQLELAALEPLGFGESSPALLALFALLRYLRESFRAGSMKLTIEFKADENTLQLDPRTVKHLDLLSSGDESGESGGPGKAGLYGLLNRCVTSAGKRELKRWLLAPTADYAELLARQESVELLFQGKSHTDALTAALSELADIERIVQRVSLRRSNPKELRALTGSLPALEALAELLGDSPAGRLRELGAALGGQAALHHLLESMLADDPPLQAGEGLSIRPGADSALDELRELHSGGSEWFRQYEEMLRAQTGIRTLKVKQTGPAGWFIEVGKASSALVPQGWERRGTLVNAERYATPELRAREAAAGSAQGRLAARERELLEALYAQVEAQSAALGRAARAAAQLDLLTGLAVLAREQTWCRVEILPCSGGLQVAVHPGDKNVAAAGAIRIELDEARHPLVEAAVGSAYYAANDCYLDQQRQQIMLLTGPNMGGKSSYLRMVAILCIINQLIGFIPAKRAALPLLDRIFTRIGAQDALARGQSTFMVEMLETARILRCCGPRSLIILDEVGRGTSTYDGISIAKAVLEYLHEHAAQPLTMFATHFFELTDLAQVLPRLENFQVEVAVGTRFTASAPPPVAAAFQPPDDVGDRNVAATGGERLLFTYRVISGAASDSFGIEVARQAGLPDSVVARAAQILAELEEARALALDKARAAVQLGLFRGLGE